MPERFPPHEEQEEDFQPTSGGADSLESADSAAFTISDGMDPIVIPERITKENYAAIFGGRLPEGISTDIFDGGGLELAEE